jgi:hypothetical protein
VFDTTGRLVKTLVEQKQTAGKHKLELRAINFTSGMYIYQLKAGDFVEKRKLVVIK